MHYRKVKKEYKRMFGETAYVRDTVIYTVNVKPNNETYYKRISSINKPTMAALMLKALSEQVPINQEEVKEHSTERRLSRGYDLNLNNEFHVRKFRRMLRRGYRGPLPS